MATNKYSVRGEADMKQHDSAIKKSASEVYKYKKQVEGTKADIKKFAGGVSDLVGKFGKFVPAIAAVSSATAIFEKTIRSTDKASDAFDSVMVQTTASVNYFFSSLARGDFSGFLDGLGKVQKAAKEARDAIDNLEDSQMALAAYGTKYGFERSRLHRIIRDPKSSKEERRKAQAELDQLPYEYERELQKAIEDAEVALIKKSKEIFATAGIGKYFDSDYIPILDAYFNPTGQDKYANTSLHNLSQEAKNELKELYTELYKLKQLKEDVFTETFKDSTFGASTSTTKSTTSKSKEREEIEVPPKIFSEEADLIAGMYTTISEANKKILDEQLNSLPALEGHIEVNEELARLYAKENDLLEEQHELLNLQIDSIYSLSSVFSNLGDTFDSTEFKAAGIITQAIATLIEGYTKAMASFAATSSPWAWIGFSVAGLATLTSVISQIHSLSGYANGGIIQGANTIGDYNLARVNSGEMILNGTQQARLFSLLNSPISGNNVSANNQVEFKIKGQDLVGIITNYNKKVGRVL